MNARRVGGWVAGLALGLVVGLALVGRLSWLAGDPRLRLEGRAVGDAEAVRVVDEQRGIVQEATLHPDGRFEVRVPQEARAIRVYVHGAGSTFTQTEVLEDLQEGETRALGALGVWSTPLRIRTDGSLLRFDWGPLPEGEGFPEKRRYSLLLVYRKVGGEDGEASLLSREPKCQLELSELYDYMPERDPAARHVEVRLRAYDPSEPSGALYNATQGVWELGREALLSPTGSSPAGEDPGEPAPAVEDAPAER